MSTKIPTKSSQVYEFLDGHPNYSRGQLRDVFNKFKPKTVNNYYDRWHKKRKNTQTSQRSTHIPQNGVGNGSPIKRRNPPVSLSKIDEVSYEAYLLSVANNSDPNINIAREIRSYLDQKKAIRIEKPKEDKTTEEVDADFQAIMNESKGYLSNIKQPSIS